MHPLSGELGSASERGIAKWRSFMEEATDLVVQHGGFISGEHGDGQSKAEFLYKMFGRELVQAFGEFKSIWDPDGKMNPARLSYPTGSTRISAWDPATLLGSPKRTLAIQRTAGLSLTRPFDASASASAAG